MSNSVQSPASPAVVEAARRRHATALRSYVAELRPDGRADPGALLAVTWEALGQLPEPESEESLAEWLFSEVRRRALAGHRGGGLADNRIDEEDDSAEAVFERLTPKQQEVLLLKFVHGFRHEQIARIVELSPAHAAQLLHVALARLSPAFRTKDASRAAPARADDHRLTLAALGELDGEDWRAWEAGQTNIAAANERLEEVRRAGQWTTSYLVSGRRRKRGQQRRRRPWLILGVAAAVVLGAVVLLRPATADRERGPATRDEPNNRTTRLSVPTAAEKADPRPAARVGGESQRLGVYREGESRVRGTVARVPSRAMPSNPAGSSATEPRVSPQAQSDATEASAPPAELRGEHQAGDTKAPVATGAAVIEPRVTAATTNPAQVQPARFAAGRPGGAIGDHADAARQVDRNPEHSGPRSAAPVGSTSTAAIVALKRALGQGRWPKPEEVNPAQLSAYFNPAPARPEQAMLFEKEIESASAPWDEGRILVRATARAPEMPPALRAPANVILLLDVSGSMAAPNRLPLVQEAVRGLLDRLRPEDRVGLVTYAGESRVLLAPAELKDTREIREIVMGLEARGRTNGGAGLAGAFALAGRDGAAAGGQVVILCTDGDFNMGATGEDELAAGVRAAAEAGVRLAIFGFGRPGEIDPRLEKLAALGRGGSGYVNTRADAISVMLAQLDELVAPAATDVSLAVSAEGGARSAVFADKLLPSDQVAAMLETAPLDPAEAVLDYRHARSGESRTESMRGRARPRDFRAASPEFRFAAAVHRFAQLLAGPPARAAGEWDNLAAWASTSVDDAGGYRAEFLALVAQARAAAANAP